MKGRKDETLFEHFDVQIICVRHFTLPLLIRWRHSLLTSADIALFDQYYLGALAGVVAP